jgi:hypothetical protein
LAIISDVDYYYYYYYYYRYRYCIIIFVIISLISVLLCTRRTCIKQAVSMSVEIGPVIVGPGIFSLRPASITTAFCVISSVLSLQVPAHLLFLLILLLTSWNRVHLQKPVVAHLLKIFPAFCEPRNFTTVCHWSLSWARWIQFTSVHHTF